MTETGWTAEMAGPRLSALFDKWSVPPADLIGKLPRGGTQLDYLGHAETTRALLEADLGWKWEPVATNEAGEPLIVVRDGTARMWIRLTVCGVTRIGVGTCPANAFDVEKQLVGDAIRNSAMRFGVALSLWSKNAWDEPHAQTPEPEPVKPKASARGKAVEREPLAVVETVDAPALNEPDEGLSTARGRLRARVEQLDAKNRALFRAFIESIGAPGRSVEMTVEQIASANAWLDEVAA